jgi:predicted nucleic acid-binding protein
MAAVMAALTSGLVRTTFELSSNTEPVAELIQRFASVPMSLADACLVRMAELYPDSVVLTFDRDFEIYRKNRGEIITVVGTREVD